MGQLIRLRIRTLAAVSLWPQTALLSPLSLSLCSCVDNPLRGKRSAVGKEGLVSWRGKAESELEACQTIRRRKIYRRAAASLFPPPHTAPDDSLVERSGRRRRRRRRRLVLPHPFGGQRGRCPLLCHRSNLSERMINCWKITCIKRPEPAETASPSTPASTPASSMGYDTELVPEIYA